MVKRITSIVVLLGLSTTSLFGTWKSWADGNIQSTYTNSAVIKTSVTTAVAGPSLRVRWAPLTTVQPIHAEAPHMSVGCNGIDIGFGSLSFLNFDEIVSKLKAIAASAPAFAFKMAVDTVCSQCSTIMQDLENVVDDINSLSLDSCKASKQLGGYAGKELTRALGLGLDQGKYQDSYQAQKEKTADERSFLGKGWNSLKTAVGGSTDQIIKNTLYGSVLTNTRVKLNPVGPVPNREFIAIARALLGDLVFYAPNNKDTITWVAPVTTYEDLMNVLIDYDGNGKLKTMDIKLYDASGKDVTDNIGNQPVRMKYEKDGIPYYDQSWTKKIYNDLNSVLTKLDAKTSLSASDKTFLASLPKNGYLYINLAHLGKAKYKENLKSFARYIALVNLYAQLQFIENNTINMVNEYLAALNPTADHLKIEALRNYQQSIREHYKYLNTHLPALIKKAEEEIGQPIEDKKKLLQDFAAN